MLLPIYPIILVHNAQRRGKYRAMMRMRRTHTHNNNNNNNNKNKNNKFIGYLQ